MSRLYPLLILIIVVAIFALGTYFLLNQKITPQANLNLAQTPSPTNAIINSVSPTQPVNNTENMDNFLTTDSGLKIQDIDRGRGRPAVSGNKVTVNYTGTLEDGTKFDSSYDRNQPFSFELGAGEVIKGWDEGVEGMREGGKRKLIIPADLGYGSQDLGTIPPNSTLIFEVELLSIQE